MSNKPHQLTLVSHDLCPFVQRAIIMLLKKGIPHDRVYIDLTAKPAWFNAISPLGKVPLLRIGDDAVLFESAVICEYLDEITPGSLHPEDPLQRAYQRSWAEFATPIIRAMGEFYKAKSAESLEEKRQVLVKLFEWLEPNLGDGPFFGGERFHLVDAMYGPVFRYWDTFDKIEDFAFFNSTPKIRAYRAAFVGRPSYENSVPPDFSDRFLGYLRRQGSELARMIERAGLA